MVTGRPLTLLAIVSVIVILGSLTPLYYYHQHPWVLVQSSRPAPLLCMSDCTSRDRLCVDWHSSLCKSVDENGCCALGTVTTKFSLQCEQACCTKSYAECIGWCVAKLRHNSTDSPTPQVTFDACRDECRLSGRSWYGERWFNQSGSGGIYRSDAMHCFMRMPRTPPSLPEPAQPRTRPPPPQPTRPAQQPNPTRATTIVVVPIDADNNETTVRYIEFH